MRNGFRTKTRRRRTGRWLRYGDAQGSDQGCDACHQHRSAITHWRCLLPARLVSLQRLPTKRRQGYRTVRIAAFFDPPLSLPRAVADLYPHDRGQRRLRRVLPRKARDGDPPSAFAAPGGELEEVDASDDVGQGDVVVHVVVPFPRAVSGACSLPDVGVVHVAVGASAWDACPAVSATSTL
jgi:hypothetical protein